MPTHTPPRRADRHELTVAGTTAPWPDFVWAVGEEGSDPIVEVNGEPFRHDQFAQSGHYDHMTHDLRSIADLGVGVVRYGMPWRRAEPEPGVFDWADWDRALGACERAGLVPVVDLLHFGLPDHAHGFADPAWIDAFCRYVDAFLARYQGPMWFTPVNEPGITAAMSARWGLWNDRLSSATDHGRVLANVVLANLEAIARVRADRSGWWIGSEGFDVPVDPSGTMPAKVERQRAIGWLVWDLHLGLEPLPAAAGYLDAIDDRTRHRIHHLAVSDRLIAGHDVYPTSVRSVDGSQPTWTIEERVELCTDELRRWSERYRQPWWISETSNLSLPITDQIPWLNALIAGLRRLHADGLPVRGLCWYSRGDQFDWQTGLARPTGAVTEVGLFEVTRQRRPVADAFAHLARDATSVGRPHEGHDRAYQR